MINENINKSANSFSTLPLNLDETKIMVLKKIKKILPNKITTQIQQNIQNSVKSKYRSYNPNNNSRNKALILSKAGKSSGKIKT